MSKYITQKNELKISICPQRPHIDIHINKKDAQIKNRRSENQIGGG